MSNPFFISTMALTGLGHKNQTPTGPVVACAIIWSLIEYVYLGWYKCIVRLISMQNFVAIIKKHIATKSHAQKSNILNSSTQGKLQIAMFPSMFFMCIVKH